MPRVCTMCWWARFVRFCNCVPRSKYLHNTCAVCACSWRIHRAKAPVAKINQGRFFESQFAFLQVKRKRILETRVAHETSRLENDGELFEHALAVRIHITKPKTFCSDKCLFTPISTAIGSIQYIITSSLSLFSTPSST